MVNIRLGKIEDLEQLKDYDWAWNGQDEIRKDYIKKIYEGKQTFLVLEDSGVVVGEFHIMWVDEDIDQANGKDRAYFSTFRIHPDYRGQGWGSRMKDTAVDMVKKRDFKEIYIGAYIDEEPTQKMYQRWGFDKEIKRSVERLPGLKEREYILFLKNL